jgi:hypothetical protein
MSVATALSLILSKINTGTWKSKMITFHSTPTLVTIESETPPEAGKLENVGELVHITKQMPWGMSTDFEAACDLVLANLSAGTHLGALHTRTSAPSSKRPNSP